MDQAAANAAGSGMPDLIAVSRALEALRLAWSDVYTFGHDEKGYWAARPGRPGTEIRRADTPEEPGGLLADDSGAGSS